MLAALAIAAQLLVPGFAERRVADRLEAGGGHADVSLDAFPVLRLLFGEGDSLKVKARRLRLEPGHERLLLERLDGFDEVQVRLRDTRMGPLDLGTFVLERPEGREDYQVRLEGETSPRALARFLGGRAGGPLGEGLGGLAGGLMGGGLPLVLNLRARVKSRGGEPTVEEAGGTVAGLPAGPLVQLALAAVLPRI
ncbi:MAG: hypothetical protein ABR581_07695 [Thermoleophilaceae bacterium]